MVKPVHTCRRIFLSFSFCSTCKLCICCYSTTPTPSSPGFMRMKWAQLLSSSFFFFFFFAFIDFHCRKKELAIISLMMFVFGCVQKLLASKLASVFAPELLSFGARLRPRWKKMRPEKWHPGSDRKILRLAQKRFFEPWVLLSIYQTLQIFCEKVLGAML